MRLVSVWENSEKFSVIQFAVSSWEFSVVLVSSREFLGVLGSSREFSLLSRTGCGYCFLNLFCNRCFNLL